MTLPFCLRSVVSLTIALPCLSFAQTVNAQVKPDQTLGSEGSLLTPLDALTQQVDGGAIRGDYLFHSFESFSIPEDSGVFFSNPDAVDHIFSRVTGTLRSAIFGTLGVLGDADLFFLNPNGVIFGPNAQLDIRGSFVVSTSDRFSFFDGSSFSAIDPDAPPLLTMNIDPGVQLGEGRSPLVNEGQLIAGEDLTLNGSVLDLKGWLAAGGDLLLQGDRVQLRDSATSSFIAQSGGALTVEGNTIDIFTLNHPESGLISSGDMVLRSSSPVIGDAHYWSGGDFRIETLDGELGLFSSVDDPVIRTAGDVAFDSYTGASLHVLAGGSVTVPGEIEITGADPENGLVETVALSNGSTVEINGRTTPTLDVRAGTTAITPPETIGDTPILTPTVPATGSDITIGGIRNPGGTVFLTNQYQPNLNVPDGTIRVGGIDTSAAGARPVIGQEIAVGGEVVLDARNNIDLIGEVNTSATAMIGSDDPSTGLKLEVTEPGDGAATATGGTIRLIADGSVTTQNLLSSATARAFVQDDTSNDGLTRADSIATAGDILIEANGLIISNNVVSSAEARAGVDAVPVPNTDLFSDVTAEDIETVTATATSGEVSFNSQSSISANTITTDATGNADAFAFVVQDDFKVGTVTGGRIGDTRVTATSGDIRFNAQDSILASGLSTRAFGDGDAFADVSTSEAGFTVGNLVGGTINTVSTITTGGDISLTSQGSTVLGDIVTVATGESRAIAKAVDTIGDVTGGTIGDVAAVMTGGTVSVNASESITTGSIRTVAETVAGSDASARDGRANVRGVGGNIFGGTVGDMGAIAIGGLITLNTGGSVTTNELVTTTQADGSAGVSAKSGPGTVVGGRTENVTVNASGGRVHINAGEAVTTEGVITNALGDANSHAFANIDDESASHLTSGQVGHHSVTAIGGTVQVETQGSVMAGDVTTIAQVDTDVSVDATLNTNEDGAATVAATGDFTAGIMGDVVMMAEGGAIALNAQDSITTGDVSTRTHIDGVANAYATKTSGNVAAGTVGTVSATANSGDIGFESQNTLTTQAVTTNAQVTNTVNADALSNESGEVASDIRGGTLDSIHTTATAGAVHFDAQNAIRSIALNTAPDLETPPALDTHAQGETIVEADARLLIDEDVTRDLYGGSVGSVSTTVEGGNITFSTQNSILTGDITTTSTNQANIDVYTRVLADDATVEGHLNSGIIDTIDTRTTGGQIDFTAQASITTEEVETTADAETWAYAYAHSNTALTGDWTGGTVGTVTTMTEGGSIHLESQDSISTETLIAWAEDDTRILTQVRGVSNVDIGAGSDLSAGSMGNIAATTTGGNIRLRAEDSINTDHTTTSAQVDTIANATVRDFRNVGATNTLRGGSIATVDVMGIGGTIEFDTSNSLRTGDVTTTVQENVTAIAYVSADVSATIAGGIDTDGDTELQGGTIGPITLAGTGGAITANAHTNLTTGPLTTTTQLNVEPKVFANVEPLVFAQGVNVGSNDLNGGEFGDITITGHGGDIIANTQASITTGNVTTTSNVNMDGNVRNRTIVNDAIYGVTYGNASDGTVSNVTVSPAAGAVSLTAADPFEVNQNINTTVQTNIDLPGARTGLQSSNGQGGAIALTSTAGSLTLQEGRSLQSNVLAGDGDGGTINLSGQSVDLQNNTLTTTVVGAGDAGAIHINANDTITITNSRLLSGREAIAIGSGGGGDIEITGGALALNEFAFLNTATFGDGNAGHVTLQSTQGDIVLNDSSIFSLTSGSGDGGAIALESAGEVQLNGNSSINTTVALGATGDGGDIRIDAASGLLIQGTDSQPEILELTLNPQLQEAEPNDGRVFTDDEVTFSPNIQFDLPRAQPIDSAFGLTDDSNVLFSEEIPFVSIAADSGTESNNDSSLDYYSFQVSAVGTQLTFDIDQVVPGDPTRTLNTILRLYDADGNILASNDDASRELGAGGSDSFNDAYLTYIFNRPGTYFIEVSENVPGEFAIPLEGARAFSARGTYNLNVSRVDDFLVSSGITTQTRSSGTSGNITINAPTVNLQNGGQISAETLRDGQAGTIALNPFSNGSQLDITLQGEGSQITGSTTNAGNSGDIVVTAPGAIAIQGNGQLRVETSGTNNAGKAGNVMINAPIVTVQDDIRISARTTGDGDGGNLEITAPTAINILDTSRFSAETTGSGRAGNATFTTGSLFLQEEARITTSATRDSTALEQGGSIALNASQLNLEGRVQILSETGSVTPAGTLTIQPDNNNPNLAIDFSGSSNGIISVSTSGTGPGGDLILMAPESITINSSNPSNRGQLTAETNGQGRAGSINVSTDDLSLNGVSLSTRSQDTATGGAGDILITATNAVLDNADILAEPTNVSEGGDIDLRITDTLHLTNQSEISASTNTGRAGQVTLNSNLSPTHIVQLNNSIVETRATGTGDAGSLELNAREITLSNNAEILASTTSGSGGDVQRNQVNNLTVQNSAISAQTRTGTAGQVTVDADGTVFVAGTRSDQTPATISVSAQGGNAGDMSITAQQLTLQDGAEVSVQNQGSSDAGNLSVTAATVSLNQGRITAETEAGTRGNIALNVRDTLDLSNNSDITASTKDGVGGSIILNEDQAHTPSVRLTGRSAIATEATSTGDAGRLDITLGSLLVDDSSLTAAAQTGSAGSLTVNAAESVQLRNNGQLSVSAVGGEAGDLGIEAAQVTVRDGSDISLSNTDLGPSGDLTISANTVALNNNGRINGETEAGTGGNIRLQVDETLRLQENSEISASTIDGQGGSITINGGTTENNRQTDHVQLRDRSTIATEATGTGDAGRLDLTLDTLLVDDSTITAAAQTGIAGSLTVDAAESIRLRNNGQLSVSAAGGEAGDLEIESPQVTVRNGSDISLSNTATGPSGDLAIAANTVTLNNTGRINAETEAGAGGNIRLQVDETLQLQDNSDISASTVDGLGGSITINSGADRNNTNGNNGPTERVELREGSAIATAATGTGNAGQIRVNAGNVTLDNQSTLTAETRSGLGGNINLRVDNELQLTNQSQILASTRSGRGGSIIVRQVDNVNLTNSTISASARAGRAGNLSINASETVTLSGTQADGTGGLLVESLRSRGGDLTIQSNQLFAENGAAISASTQTGQAGDVIVETSESIHLTGTGTEISARARQSGGVAGDVDVTTNHLTINDNAAISASNIDAQTGQGNITLEGLETLNINNGDISATTNTGEAGSIIIDASESIHLSNSASLSVETGVGASPNANPSSNPTRLSRRPTVSGIRASEEPTPIGGDIEIRTDELDMDGNSRILVRSPNGQAGNIDINANVMTLDASEIRATTSANAIASEDSATITIEGLEVLFLSNSSLISAEALDGADGGNIVLNAEEGFIVAPLNTNNDLIATAIGGDGGRIDISAQQLIGFQENSGTFESVRSSPANDMSVTSTLGTDGVIVVNDLGLDPVQAAADLPIDTAPPPLSQGCQPGGNGRFTNSERQGIPPSLDDPNSSDRGWEDIQPMDSDSNVHHVGTVDIWESEGAEQSLLNQMLGEGGWVINDQGEIELTNHTDADSTQHTCQLNEGDPS